MMMMMTTIMMMMQMMTKTMMTTKTRMELQGVPAGYTKGQGTHTHHHQNYHFDKLF
jgi:hypothetical protein